MAPFRFGLLLVALLLLQLLFLSRIPWVAQAVDPLLLVLIFIGFRIRSARFLWAYGVALGFLKDLVTGNLFGVSGATFGLVGWLMASARHLVEREDPILQGIWAGLLSMIQGLATALLLMAMEPAVRSIPGWGILPALMLVNGGIAAWGFPRLERWLDLRCDF